MSVCKRLPVPSPCPQVVTYPGKLAKHAPVSQVEDVVAKDGSNEPSYRHHAQCAQAHEHEGVETAELGRERGIVAIADHGGEPVVRHSQCPDARACLANPTPGPSQGEEVVPRELSLRAGGRAGCGW